MANTRSVHELTRLKQEIEGELAAAIARDRPVALEQVKQTIAQYGLTAVDLGLSSARKSAAKGQSTGAGQPKYRDPATGATWTGKGMAPGWLKNSKLPRESFLVVAQGAGEPPKAESAEMKPRMAVGQRNTAPAKKAPSKKAASKAKPA